MAPLATRFDELKALIAGSTRVVVAGHARADGDSVGAVCALRRHLEIEGKDVHALLLEPLSARYGFMEFQKHYEVFDPVRHAALLASTDVFVMCDLSSISRLGPLGEAVAAAGCRTVCVDHHPCDDDGPADINLLDSTATASGRIVWDYIRHVGGRVDREIAEGVFVSLSTDTGWFRYDNTDASVLALAAELAGYRLEVPAIHRTIYQSNSVPMLRLLGHVARSLNEECEGAFVWAVIRDELVRDLGVKRLDGDPILDVLRSAEKVSVVALFTEQPDRSVSVSLRSRGVPDVNRIARDFGGGGHAFAAGASLEPETAERETRRLVATIRKAVRAD
jgi:bifunctional oligoribonuclease and PAP phosphatase NrnA